MLVFHIFALGKFARNTVQESRLVLHVRRYPLPDGSRQENDIGSSAAAAESAEVLAEAHWQHLSSSRETGSVLQRRVFG